MNPLRRDYFLSQDTVDPYAMEIGAKLLIFNSIISTQSKRRFLNYHSFFNIFVTIDPLTFLRNLEAPFRPAALYGMS